MLSSMLERTRLDYFNKDLVSKAACPWGVPSPDPLPRRLGNANSVLEKHRQGSSTT